MPVAVIVPIRSFQHGKDRLSRFLEPEHRTLLGAGMAERTVAAAEAALLLPVIVTGAGDVQKWAVDLGLMVVPEVGAGLNSAAHTGCEWAAANGLAWTILHSDLPLVTPGELNALGAAVESGRDVIAPSSDGGTTAISSTGPVRFAYGPGSFWRHLPQLTDPVILTTVGTLHDLDSPADLQTAATSPGGAWLRAIADSVDDSARSGKEI